MGFNVAEAKARITAQTEGQDKVTQLTNAVKDLSAQTKMFAEQAAVSGNSAARLAAQAQSAGNRVVVSAAQQRAGMQQLAQQTGDLSLQFVMAAQSSDPLRMAFMALSQQGGQIISAVQLMKGELTGVAAFLAGPWGGAVIAGTAVLGPMIANLLGIGRAADDAQTALGRMVAKYRQAEAERNRFASAGKELDENLSRRAELEARIRLVGVRGPNGQIMNVYKEQQELRELNKTIDVQVRSIDAERMALLPLDRVMQGIGETRRTVTNHVRSHSAALTEAQKAAQAYAKAEEQMQVAIARSNFQFDERMRKIGSNTLATAMIGAPEREAPTIWDQIARENESQVGKMLGGSSDEGLTGYGKRLADTGRAAMDAWDRALRGTEDAIVSFVTTGKLSFKDLANSIISDLVRIAIQQAIIKPIAGFLGLKFAKGAAFSGGDVVPFANGGVFGGGMQAFASGTVVSQPTLFPMSGGRTGLMAEAGPEAIMPLKRMPGGRLGVEAVGTGGGVNVSVNVDASGTQVQGNAGGADQLGRVIGQAVQAELIKQQRPGGLLSGAR